MGNIASSKSIQTRDPENKKQENFWGWQFYTTEEKKLHPVLDSTSNRDRELCIIVWHMIKVFPLVTIQPTSHTSKPKWLNAIIAFLKKGGHYGIALFGLGGHDQIYSLSVTTACPPYLNMA